MNNEWLKMYIRKCIHIMSGSNQVLKLLNVISIRVAEGARWLQMNTDAEKAGRCLKVICPDLVVRHGPFKGMKYPGMESFGSALFPKLIGSYEREIHYIIEEICKNKYTEVVDVGCAEGYYAVGLAMRLQNARIYAYDTNKNAVRACKKMAEINNVGQRVITGFFCDSQVMQSIPFRGKALIFCDCEGYETSLFLEGLIPALARHDLLVELHDFIDINISSIIRKRFENTHEIIAVESIDDIKKAQTYNYEELEKYSLQERRQLLSEWRPSIMQWFYLRSLKSS